MKKLLLIPLLLIALAACDLERSNPLENTPEPGIVHDIQLLILNTGDEQKTVHVSWSPVNNADGYHIYRALSHGGMYDKIGPETGIPPSDSLYYNDSSNVFAGHTYWYKMSAFNEFGLEGTLSTAQPIVIPQ